MEGSERPGRWTGRAAGAEGVGPRFRLAASDPARPRPSCVTLQLHHHPVTPAALISKAATATAAAALGGMS